MMSKRFLEAFKNVIGIEGGYVNDPADRGGETKYGICKRDHQDLDIKNLTLEQAKAIYYTEFWAPLKLDDILDPQIAEEMFDTAVNCGVKPSIRITQRALRFLGEPITQDGILGPATLEKVNKWSQKDPTSLYKAMNGYQFMKYAGIVEADESQGRFARGWLKRIQSYRN